MALSILPPLQPLALPSFTSALITGSLPSSVALHLSISHLSDLGASERIPKESTAIFAPSPDLYETERGRGERLFVDEWIETHGLHGEYAHKLARTHIFTVSTPRQLAAHLALWNCSDSTVSSKQTRDSVVDPSSTTLIILHNLSLLFPPSSPEVNRNPFLRDIGQGGTLLSLVVQVLAWGGPRKPRVAVLDSFLDPSSTTHTLLRKYVQYTGQISSPRSIFSDSAERDEGVGGGEPGSEIEYAHEGGTRKFMLRMRDKEGNELVWGW